MTPRCPFFSSLSPYGGGGSPSGVSGTGPGAFLHLHVRQGDKGRNGHYAETAHQLREGFRPRAPRGRTMAPHRSPAIPPTRSGEQHGLRAPTCSPPLDMSRRLGNTRAFQGRSACKCKWPAAAAPVRQRASSGTRAGSVSTGLSHGGQSPPVAVSYTHLRAHETR